MVLTRGNYYFDNRLADHMPGMNQTLQVVKMAKAKPRQTSNASARPAAAQVGKKNTNYMKVFFIFWGIIFAIGLITVALFKVPAMVLLVMLFVAAVSFVLMLSQLLQHWEGTVQELKTVKETRSSGDDDWVTEEVTYAFVKLTNGKLKKMRNGGWKVGDHLKKEKGEMDVRVL